MTQILLYFISAATNHTYTDWDWIKMYDIHGLHHRPFIGIAGRGDALA